MADIEIFVTADGSHSLRNSRLNETYHSVHGAIQESIHVFIDQGLSYFREKHKSTRIHILEVGFGTGLNALLTLKYAQENFQHITYTSLESDPIGGEIVQQLNYSQFVNLEKASKLFQKLHAAAWDREEVISDYFVLQKIRTRLQDLSAAHQGFDVIYFDAFAPGKQPELWEVSQLQKVERAMNSEGVFVTYCAKGQLKRDLKTLNLKVETLAGPPGKKEMVRAIKS